MKVEKQILKLDHTNAEAHQGISAAIKNIVDRDLTSKPKLIKKN